jgi:uncharacterized protein involved in outer membrane biogenesis
MRFVTRLFFVLVAASVVGFAALAILFPRLAQSEAVRVRLQRAAQEMLGREVSWESLSVGLLPPRLVARGPKIAGQTPKDPPQLEARNIDLRVALMPLLARTLVIDSLEIEGVAIRLERTPQGVSLPGIATKKPVPKPGDASASEPPGSGVSLALRRLRLVDSRIELVDRAVEPTTTWQLENVEATIEGMALDAPLNLDVSGQLAQGGRLQVKGTASLDGTGDLRVELDGVPLDRLGPYAGAQLAGRASGSVELTGALADPQELGWNLRIVESRIVQSELELSGSVASQGQLSGGLARGTGSFTADATQAELRYGTVFQKPAGKRALVSGSLVLDPKAGLAVRDLELRLDANDITGQLRTQPRAQLELAPTSIDIGSLASLVPPLRELKPAGKATLGELVVRTDPLELRGQAQLDPLRLESPRGAPIVLTGGFEATGSQLASRGLAALVASQSIPIELGLRDLAGSPRYTLRAHTEKVDLDALLQALTSAGGKLSGALTSDLNVAGPLGGVTPLLEALAGEMRLDLREGRVRGVSLLQGAMERMGALGEVVLILGSIRGGKTLQRFYEDTFESITGTFRLANGKARTDSLQLLYRHYSVDLKGVYGLVDSSLDFTGKLTIDPEVSAALVSDPEAAADTPADPAAQQRVIPLAHVGGTLSSPRVDIGREAALGFATALATRRSGKLERVEGKIDERLGEGAGKEILGTLEQILGTRKPQTPAPSPDPPATP